MRPKLLRGGPKSAHERSKSARMGGGKRQALVPRHGSPYKRTPSSPGMTRRKPQRTPALPQEGARM
eukprot:7785922-Pyramimonas_sp.AAC.1